MRTLAGKRPEIWLLASLLLFGAVLFTRQTTPAPLSIAVPSDDVSSEAVAALPIGSERAINTLKARVRQNPDDTVAYAQLGLALLQRVRDTADVTLYDQAQQAFDAALARDKNQLDALIGKGSLALARHQFVEALALGQRARDVNPYRAAVYGIMGDALTELGRYDEAAATIDKMIDTRPDLSSYGRAAYQYELHGETESAIHAFDLAISAGGPARENTAWTITQLGNLYFNNGRLEEAEERYNAALAARPEDPYAGAGLAKIQAARGNLAAATAAYQQIVTRLPLPEFVITLGELYEAQGQTQQAQDQYDLVRAMQQLNAKAGIDVDLELALFDADHGGNPAQAVERARASYSRRPSILGADALAWALYRSGAFAEAATYSSQALRLGTRDAAMHYRAGMIAAATGENAAAQRYLRAALEINPHFSFIHAAEARAKLIELEQLQK